MEYGKPYSSFLLNELHVQWPSQMSGFDRPTSSPMPTGCLREPQTADPMQICHFYVHHLTRVACVCGLGFFRHCRHARTCAARRTRRTQQEFILRQHILIDRGVLTHQVLWPRSRLRERPRASGALGAVTPPRARAARRRTHAACRRRCSPPAGRRPHAALGLAGMRGSSRLACRRRSCLSRRCTTQRR